MNDAQLLRFSRHLLLEDIDVEGQEKLLNSHALVIGAGGLGSAAAPYLAAAGVGQITLVDHDEVDLTNLQRQIMHSEAMIGKSKVESGKHFLHQLNPNTQVHAIQSKADTSLLDNLLPSVDIVLDCTDNFKTRHAINHACVAAKVPLVSGAAIRMDGQVAVFDSRQVDAPCYACLFPPDQQFEEVQCSVMGVFAPLVGIIGTMQAAEALKLVMGVGTSLAHRLLMLDARTMEWTSIKTTHNPHCTVCG